MVDRNAPDFSCFIFYQELSFLKIMLSLIPGIAQIASSKPPAHKRLSQKLKTASFSFIWRAILHYISERFYFYGFNYYALYEEVYQLSFNFLVIFLCSLVFMLLFSSGYVLLLSIQTLWLLFLCLEA